MERVYNFSAGPSMMPLPVLERAQRDLLCYPGAGCSVMEMSHRSPAFEAIIERAEADLRALCAIPDSYAVLFLQGGASTQFSMIPMNLVDRAGTAAYVETDEFAKKAIREAARWCNAVTVASSADKKFSYIPEVRAEDLPQNAAYLHITVNNTLFGTQYHRLPQLGVPLVGDLSSAMLGQLYDIEDFVLIYAGAQKNMGPAGVTVVALRRDLLRDLPEEVPTMLDYKVQVAGRSMHNTPPCWGIYMTGLMLDWILREGGVEEMARRNNEKSGLLYEFLDNSAFYTPTARPQDRSNMNITFTLPDEALSDLFAKGAAARGLINLKGHRLVGGIRANIYNAMPIEGVRALLNYMKDFEMEHRMP